jgi:hypothetical protein
MAAHDPGDLPARLRKDIRQPRSYSNKTRSYRGSTVSTIANLPVQQTANVEAQKIGAFLDEIIEGSLRLYNAYCRR